MRQAERVSSIRPAIDLRSTLREPWVPARMLLRRPTQRWRLLPAFLLIGGQRCGTTSLYNYLAAHPDIVQPLTKEPQFFSHQWRRGLDWYRSMFPLPRPLLPGGPQDGLPRRITFEASPYYLFHPLAAERAGSLVPDAKLIVLLRNPVERAYSHYWHSVRLGVETLSFEAAIDAEAQRLAGEDERIVGEDGYPGRNHRFFSYATRGYYAEQLERWWRHFPRERCLVLISEDLFDDPRRVYDDVVRFLGLRPWRPAEFPVSNRRIRKRPSPMAETIRASLVDRFRPANCKLQLLLGRRLNWDTAPTHGDLSERAAQRGRPAS